MSREVIQIFKSLSFLYVPAASTQFGTITINIGKYYDNNAVRIAKVWAYTIYNDVTAGSADQEANSYLQIGSTSIMGIPAANYSVTSGLASGLAGCVIPGGAGGQFDILGDSILESPIFTIAATGDKKTPGGYPPAYQFRFYITVQFEFNVDNLDEQALSKFIRELS